MHSISPRAEERVLLRMFLGNSFTVRSENKIWVTEAWSLLDLTSVL